MDCLFYTLGKSKTQRVRKITKKLLKLLKLLKVIVVGDFLVL